MISGYADLADAISTTIEQQQRKKMTAARVGVIQGNSVVSNGRSYALESAIDINPYDGRIVYFLISSSGHAVIVGA